MLTKKLNPKQSSNQMTTTKQAAKQNSNTTKISYFSFGSATYELEKN